MELINDIRRRNGGDYEVLRRAQEDPEIARTFAALRANLAQALESLSTDLYASPSRFLLEFIQNAADNKYADGVTPTLNMTVNEDFIIFQCNEVGFSAANVEAICKIGASTKNKNGFIGEKGIGFKAAFRLADVVYICSNEYTFKFDKDEVLGMITPIWTDQYPVRPGWTSFYLQLSPSEDSKTIISYVGDIRPSLLLFLPQLRQMNIEIQLRDNAYKKSIQLSRIDGDSDIVILKDSRSEPEHYLMVKHIAKTFEHEKKREGVTKSEIVLAFPITQAGTPKIAKQPVYAFLPLKSYGFTFVIQADFLTAANREDIRSGLPWNTTLRMGVVDAFLLAVDRFQQYPGLEFLWHKFLPDVYEPFFNSVETAIFRALQKRTIFRCADGLYRLPSQCIILADVFCDEGGEPLIPEQFLHGDRYYLSKSYNVVTHNRNLLRLGVRDMSDDLFLAGLKNMNSKICDQSERWQESTCQRLYRIYRAHLPSIWQSTLDLGLEHTLELTQEQKNVKALSDITQLRILPLSDGTWTSADSKGDIMFDCPLVGIPGDLDVRVIGAGVKNFTFRYMLFRALGVKQVIPKVVATQIMELHHSGSCRKSRKSLIQHARFLFTYRDSKGVPCPAGMLVMDQDGDVVEGTEVHCDFPDVEKKVCLRRVLPSPAKFLHPTYLVEKDWWRWLREEIGVKYFPRLVDDGNLSPEFWELSRTIDTPTLLLLLMETWPQWEASLSVYAKPQLRNIEVRCLDGRKQPLNATYIGRGAVATYSDLPFLPISQPDHRDWDFLSDLGVTHKIDGDFFIKRLINLKEEGSGNEKAIRDTYEQIQARFEDNPQYIRSAFDQQPLIFASAREDEKKKWIAKSDAIWTGPSSITSKIALKSSYPEFRKLFQDQLGIAAAGPLTLVAELKGLGTKWREQAIPLAINDHVSRLLCDISDLIEESKPHEPSPEWLSSLGKDAIFPVEFPSRTIMLRACEDRFYIPDGRGRCSVVSHDIPLLSLAAPVEIHQIKPILDSGFFAPYLHLEQAYFDLLLVHSTMLPMLNVTLYDALVIDLPLCSPVDYVYADASHVKTVVRNLAVLTQHGEVHHAIFVGNIIFQRLIVYVFVHLLLHISHNRLLNEFEETLRQWKTWDYVTVIQNHQLIKNHLWDLFQRGRNPQSNPTWQSGDAFRKIAAIDAIGLCAHLTVMVTDNNNYKEVLTRRGTEAQSLLDLIQARLEFPMDAVLKAHYVNALLRLSRATGLYPECLALKGIQMEAAPVDRGGFGDVYKGVLHGKVIAVKALRVYQTSNIVQLLKSFSSEAVLWKQLSHPNVLPFYGVYHLDEGTPRLCLTAPWMENGNVVEFLKRFLDTYCIHLALDMAQGLEYLHGLAPSIVHGDLKGVNVLISKSGRACLADFGLARAMDAKTVSITYSSTVKYGGTMRWQAPELLSSGADDDSGGPQHSSKASDIYAFACVCYEMFAGEIPFFENPYDVQVALRVVRGKRPIRPSHDFSKTRGFSDDTWDLIQASWAQDPAQRPTAKEVVFRLKALPNWRDDQRPLDDFKPNFPSQVSYNHAEHPFSGLTATADQEC